MKTSAVGIALIKRFEGLRLEAYYCPAGVLTIGYGHTSAAGAPIVKKGMKISEVEADRILTRDLQKYEDAVLKALKTKPNQNQFDAMVSLCYNIGTTGFSKSSVVKRFNEGNIQSSAAAFKLWNKADGRVLEGLVRRRKAESELFMTPATVVKPVESAKPKDTVVSSSEVSVKGTEKSVAAIVIGAILAAFAAFAVWLIGGN
jgi:lysozyme